MPIRMAPGLAKSASNIGKQAHFKRAIGATPGVHSNLPLKGLAEQTLDEPMGCSCNSRP